MDKHAKALWIEALESGEYKQTTGSLRVETADSVEYCCLGVLCEVAIKDGVDVKYDSKRLTYDGNSAFLPRSVQTWAGFKFGDDSGNLRHEVEYIYPSTSEKGSSLTLLGLNDAAEWSFPEIAKVIAEQL